jgi:hypothetical protein
MLLALILQDQNMYGVETKELLKRSLANFIRKEGPDGVNTAVSTSKLGKFYYDLAMMQSMASTKRTQLLLAKSHIVEALRIETKVHDSNHPHYLNAASLLSDILRELSGCN